MSFFPCFAIAFHCFLIPYVKPNIFIIFLPFRNSLSQSFRLLLSWSFFSVFLPFTFLFFVSFIFHWTVSFYFEPFFKTTASLTYRRPYSQHALPFLPDRLTLISPSTLSKAPYYFLGYPSIFSLTHTPPPPPPPKPPYSFLRYSNVLLSHAPKLNLSLLAPVPFLPLRKTNMNRQTICEFVYHAYSSAFIVSTNMGWCKAFSRPAAHNRRRQIYWCVVMQWLVVAWAAASGVGRGSGGRGGRLRGTRS